MREQLICTDVCPLTHSPLYSARHKSGALFQILHSDTRLPSASVTLSFGGAVCGLRDGSEYIQVPPGAAHFLEHMLFNKEGLNDRFTELGADVNALTYLSHTSYYFTTRRDFFESLSSLMEMVLAPSFPKETFRKERQIILCELEEEKGDVFVLGQGALTRSLFRRSPLRRDVGGSARDVRGLSFDSLCKIADAVCRPDGAVISVVSPYPPEQVWEHVSAFLDGLSIRPAAKRSFSATLQRDGSEARFFRAQTDTPMLFAALSPSPELLGRSKAADYVFSSLLEDMLYDRSEPFWNAFSEECRRCGVGLFGELDSQSETFLRSGILSVSVPTSSPSLAAKAFERTFTDIRKDGSLLCRSHLESKRRGLVADYLSTLDSPATTCLAIGEYAAFGESLFDEARTIESLDKEDFLKKATDALASSTPVFACGSRSGRLV